MIGIYKITNLITKQAYIGQSVNIERRKRQHLNTAYSESNKYYNNPLYRAIRKYGIENFDFEILENCSIEKLNQQEKYWIKKYDTFFHGYNLTFGGDGSGNKQTKESIIGIFNDLENTNLTQKEIANKWNISEEMVQGINTGRYWRTQRIYPIRKSQEKQHFYCIDCGIEISRNSKRCLSCQNKSRKQEKPVSREKLKQLIRTTPFTRIGEYYGVTDNTIRKWCDSYNLPRKKKDIEKYTQEEWNAI